MIETLRYECPTEYEHLYHMNNESCDEVPMNIESKKVPHFTIALIVLNVAYFFFLTARHILDQIPLLIDYGALFWPLVIQEHQYYRLFTSLFIHFNINHLVNNMVMLGILGQTLELERGKIRFILIYFISGLGGSTFSLYYNYMNQSNVISGGASGAIFGLMGALLAFVLITRRPLGRLSKRGMIFCVVFSLYIGFTSSGVDNIAHIGGLIVGFLVGLLMSLHRT